MGISPAMYDLLLEFKIERLTPQKVIGVLKKAGMHAAIRTKRKRRSGFDVAKVTPATVMVSYADWEDLGNRVEQFEKAILALQNAGYTLAIGFGSNRRFDDEALPEIRKNGTAIVMKKKAE